MLRGGRLPVAECHRSKFGVAEEIGRWENSGH